jgi:hypothetical protein
MKVISPKNPLAVGNTCFYRQCVRAEERYIIAEIDDTDSAPSSICLDIPTHDAIRDNVGDVVTGAGTLWQ